MSTSCDAENVGGRHEMEESDPAVITVFHVLNGGMSLPILLEICRGRVKAQLNGVWACEYTMLMGLSSCI